MGENDAWKMMFTVCRFSLFPTQQEKGEEASGQCPANAAPLNQAPPPSRSAHRWHVIARHWLRQTRSRTSGVLPVTTRSTGTDRELVIRSFFTFSLISVFTHGKTGRNRPRCSPDPMVLLPTCLATTCQTVFERRHTAVRLQQGKSELPLPKAIQWYYRVKYLSPYTHIIVLHWHVRKFFCSAVLGKS